MSGSDASQWRTTFGGTGAPRRPARDGIVAVIVLGALLSGCVSPGPRTPETGPAEVRAGIELYEAGEFVLAADRFARAADEAERCREPVLERRVRAAECTAWLRARRLDEFASCSARLEDLQRRGRPDPGLNTLIALGAIAGRRPLPPLRLPNAVHGVVHAAAEEGR